MTGESAAKVARSLFYSKGSKALRIAKKKGGWRSRLKHAAKHRKQSLDILVQAKKKNNIKNIASSSDAGSSAKWQNIINMYTSEDRVCQQESRTTSCLSNNRLNGDLNS